MTTRVTRTPVMLSVETVQLVEKARHLRALYEHWKKTVPDWHEDDEWEAQCAARDAEDKANRAIVADALRQVK